MKRFQKQTIGFKEFIILMATYIALMAMSIDTILPALFTMAKDFHVENSNKIQYVIGILFLGFTFGQIVFGPLADSFGRKITIYFGLIIFIIGNILSISASTFEVMLLGRFLQGFGASSPRINSIAIIRDLYRGREMARVMSFIMTIFILIPIIAPTIGQAILLVASWQTIFYIFLIAAIIAFFWTYFRLPETLKKDDKRPFAIKIIWQDFCKVVNNKTTLGYTICAGLIFSALIGYLTSSRQIFQDYFQVGNLFPLYFAMSAISIGAASIVNSMIVRRLGMKLISHHALIVIIFASILLLPINIFYGAHVSLALFMAYILIVFFCLGLLFGNLNALAMEPMGHIAGIASAVVGSLSSAISSVIGTIIGQAYNGSLIPINIGFITLAISAFILQRKLDHDKN